MLDESHLSELLQQHTVPPVADVEAKSALVRMGFPTFARTMVLDKKAVKASLAPNGQATQGSEPSAPAGALPVRETGIYTCPRCLAQQTDLPAECIGCGLFLVLTPHLARTFHHLFPLAEFKEEEQDTNSGSGYCAGCTKQLQRLVSGDA